MITSADEFIGLRTSSKQEEQEVATHDSAELSVWTDIINRYPKFKPWVVHNKTVPLEILEILAEDADPDVRAAVAKKRKINDKIVSLLAIDGSKQVRHALISNTKLSKDQLRLIKSDDSKWLKAALKQKLAK